MGQTSISSSGKTVSWFHNQTHAHTLKKKAERRFRLKSSILRRTWLDRCRLCFRLKESDSAQVRGQAQAGSGDTEGEEEAAAASHSQMAFKTCDTTGLRLTLCLFFFFFSFPISSSSGAVWVCSDSRGRGGERHPESASSVKGITRLIFSPPSTGLLCLPFYLNLLFTLRYCIPNIVPGSSSHHRH